MQNALSHMPKKRHRYYHILRFFIPEILRNCKNEQGKLDPPLVLYYRGDIKVLETPGIAVIGTREPTPNGIKAGEFFAFEFPKEVLTLSLDLP